MSIRLSDKIYRGGAPGCLLHYCPGCEQLHMIAVDRPNSCGAQWVWNGDTERPTFSPSINIVGQCHYFIRDGVIEFCADSKHALAGKSVALPDMPDWWTERRGDQ